MLRNIFMFLFVCFFVTLTACSRVDDKVNNNQVPDISGERFECFERFKVIYEHPETKNLGGFTVLRDTVTGQEYLVITGLNGAPAVIPLKENSPSSDRAAITVPDY